MLARQQNGGKDPGTDRQKLGNKDQNLIHAFSNDDDDDEEDRKLGNILNGLSQPINKTPDPKQKPAPPTVNNLVVPGGPKTNSSDNRPVTDEDGQNEDDDQDGEENGDGEGEGEGDEDGENEGDEEDAMNSDEDAELNAGLSANPRTLGAGKQPGVSPAGNMQPSAPVSGSQPGARPGGYPTQGNQTNPAQLAPPGNSQGIPPAVGPKAGIGPQGNQPSGNMMPANANARPNGAAQGNFPMTSGTGQPPASITQPGQKPPGYPPANPGMNPQQSGIPQTYPSNMGQPAVPGMQPMYPAGGPGGPKPPMNPQPNQPGPGTIPFQPPQNGQHPPQRPPANPPK